MNTYEAFLSYISCSTSGKQFYSPVYNPSYLKLAKKLRKILKCCGEICETDPIRLKQPKKKGKYFDFLEKEVSCHALFGCHKDIDKAADLDQPPKFVSYMESLHCKKTTFFKHFWWSWEFIRMTCPAFAAEYTKLSYNERHKFLSQNFQKIICCNVCLTNLSN